MTVHIMKVNGVIDPRRLFRWQEEARTAMFQERTQRILVFCDTEAHREKIWEFLHPYIKKNKFSVRETKGHLIVDSPDCIEFNSERAKFLRKLKCTEIGRSTDAGLDLIDPRSERANLLRKLKRVGITRWPHRRRKL